MGIIFYLFSPDELEENWHFTRRLTCCWAEFAHLHRFAQQLQDTVCMQTSVQEALAKLHLLCARQRKCVQMRLQGPGMPDDKLLGCVQMVCPTTLSGEEHQVLRVLVVHLFGNFGNFGYKWYLHKKRVTFRIPPLQTSM